MNSYLKKTKKTVEYYDLMFNRNKPGEAIEKISFLFK